MKRLGRDLSLIASTAFVCTCLLSIARSGVERSAGDEKVVYTRGDLVLYIEKWGRRDGSAGVVISDYFCDFVSADPKLFFAVMEENRSTFDEWLDKLADLSFVDRGGCVDLECERQSMLKDLGMAGIRPEDEDLRKRLVNRLKSIAVRKLD